MSSGYRQARISWFIKNYKLKGPSSQAGEGTFSLSKNSVIVSLQWACRSGSIRRVESSAKRTIRTQCKKQKSRRKRGKVPFSATLYIGFWRLLLTAHFYMWSKDNLVILARFPVKEECTCLANMIEVFDSIFLPFAFQYVLPWQNTSSFFQPNRGIWSVGPPATCLSN